MLQDEGEPTGSSITMNDRYRIGELARQTGITIRTLQYYDRIGLLRPQARSEAGYRWYGADELIRLQQIVTLKALGFRLDAIASFLDAEAFDFVAALDEQIALLDERARRITAVIEAMQAAKSSVRENPPVLRERLVHVIRSTLIMQEIDFQSHFSPEQLAALKTRELSADEQARVSAAWEQLFADIAAAKESDPGSTVARALLVRWDELTAAFTQRDPAMEQSLAGLYADPKNRAKAASAIPGLSEAWAFIARVRAASERG